MKNVNVKGVQSIRELRSDIVAQMESLAAFLASKEVNSNGNQN